MNLNKLVPERKVYTTAGRNNRPSYSYKDGYNQAIDDMEKNIAKAKVGLNIFEIANILIETQARMPPLSRMLDISQHEIFAQALADKTEELITIEMEPLTKGR